jgi:protein-disulfide isomerase
MRPIFSESGRDIIFLVSDEALEIVEVAPPAVEEADTQDASPEITITLRRGHLFAILLPLAFLFGLGLGYLVWGRAPVETAATAAAEASSPGESEAQDREAASSTPQQVIRYDVPADGDPALGPADAAITIIEFSDYECPYCQRWHVEVFDRLMETYADQVRLVYRDFPLTSIHPNAFAAAEAANCANEQGGFWGFHDRLFSMELGLSSQAYQQYARQLGLDEEAFRECLDSGKYKEEVQSDFDYAAELGVRSTPTFFINGIAVVGAQPYEVFQQIIDKELAGEIP